MANICMYVHMIIGIFLSALCSDEATSNVKKLQRNTSGQHFLKVFEAKRYAGNKKIHIRIL